MDSMSPKSAELSQIARNQLRTMQNLNHHGLITNSNRSGIVGRTIRFVFTSIPDFWSSRLGRPAKTHNSSGRRRAKI